MLLKLLGDGELVLSNDGLRCCQSKLKVNKEKKYFLMKVHKFSVFLLIFCESQQKRNHVGGSQS